MNLRAFISCLVLTLGVSAQAEPIGYGMDYSVSDIPNSSIYQMLYRPQVREDVPFTSVYSQIYDEGYDGDFERDDDYLLTSSLSGLENENEFNTAFASDFSVSKDFFGTGGLTGSNFEQRRDAALSCPNGYFSESLDATTLTMRKSCSSLDIGEVDTTGGNAFLANSQDRALQKYGDANNFIGAMKADARRLERMRAAAMASGDSGEVAKHGFIMSEDMVALLEKLAMTSPGLSEVLDEAIATGDMKVIYRRIHEAGGLEALVNQTSNNQQYDFNLSNGE